MWKEWQSQERRYQICSDSQTFTKIEIPSWLDIEGNKQTPWMSKERLTNEYHALRFITESTTIPVPKPLRLEDVDGCLALTTEWIDGVPFDDLDPQVRSTSYLDEYVRTTILPQLNTLKSHTSGTTHGVILPPRRLFDICLQRQWYPRTSKREYHYTHNDLAQHNFLCNQKTGKVEAVIDWEFAGFYPGFFEAPLWRAPYNEIEDDQKEITRMLQFLELDSPASPFSERTSRHKFVEHLVKWIHRFVPQLVNANGKESKRRIIDDKEETAKGDSEAQTREWQNAIKATKRESDYPCSFS